MNETRHRTARSALAAYHGMPPRAIEDARFQPSRTNLPIYFINGSYWCSPSEYVAAPRGWDWQDLGEMEGRRIFKSENPHAAFR